VNEWWEAIIQTIFDEFSDLPDVSTFTRITLRMLLAAILGGILGLEREQQRKAAGLRTHMLVALGAALFVLIPQQSGVSDADLTRVLQGLVAGVGFLGAGCIIKGQAEEEVKGLTTAANIWLTAAIGMAAGIGREATAVISTLIALLILSSVRRIERYIEKRSKSV
jgi:putative Mg2+ transporter-C (MgtC) family protein